MWISLLCRTHFTSLVCCLSLDCWVFQKARLATYSYPVDKQTNLFSVSYQNALYVSLRSNKRIECISFLTFAKSIFKAFWILHRALFTSTFAKLTSIVVDQLFSLQPATGKCIAPPRTLGHAMCVLVHVHQIQTDQGLDHRNTAPSRY